MQNLEEINPGLPRLRDLLMPIAPIPGDIKPPADIFLTYFLGCCPPVRTSPGPDLLKKSISFGLKKVHKHGN